MRLRCARCGCYLRYTDEWRAFKGPGEFHVQPCKRCLHLAFDRGIYAEYTGDES